MPLAVVSIALSVGVVAGIVLRARKEGLHPIHVAALLFLPIMLLWNYALLDRFALPFLTLFLAGASHELTRLAAATRASWSKSPAADRIVIAAFASVLIALVSFSFYRGFWSVPRGLGRLTQARVELAAPKQEAYRWLSANAQPGAAVISYEDAALFLYAGRRGMRAFSPSTDSFFAQDETLLERDLNRLTDTAAALGAHFWLCAPDDFEMTHAPEQIRARVAKDLSTAPVVFASSDGQVRVRDVSGMPWNRPRAAAARLSDRNERPK
jgi:hypothetical protein